MTDHPFVTIRTVDGQNQTYGHLDDNDIDAIRASLGRVDTEAESERCLSVTLVEGGRQVEDLYPIHAIVKVTIARQDD